MAQGIELEFQTGSKCRISTTCGLALVGVQVGAGPSFSPLIMNVCGQKVHRRKTEGEELDLALIPVQPLNRSPLLLLFPDLSERFFSCVQPEYVFGVPERL